MRPICALAAASCLFILPVSLGASDIEVPMIIGGDAGALDLEAIEGGIPLSLEDAIAISLERNLGLAVQRYTHTRSLLRLAETFGIYDLELGATLSSSEATSPVSSTLIDTGGSALQSESFLWNAQLSRLFPVGGTATVSFQSQRTESNNATNFINPRFDQGLRFAYTQPLLRNFGKTATERDIIVQRLTSVIGAEDFDTRVEQLVQDIADSFWQLVEAREQLEVAEEALALAEELHKNNGIQVRVGTLAPLETVRSEAGVADRKVDIISRTAAVEDLEDGLRRLMNLDQGSLWSTPIVPTIEDEIQFPKIDLGKSIKAALERRNDLRRKRLEIEQAKVDAKIAANRIKPQLDLDANYTYNGLGGETLVPGTGLRLGGGFSDALNQVLGREFDRWQVQLTFGLPVRNRAARARAAGAELAVEQFQAEFADLEQEAITTVRRLARGVESAARQIDAARVSARLEEKNLEAERKRYENGLSASFEILRIQEDLAQARSREVSAVANYRRALVSLYRGTGELLHAHSVSLVDGVDPRATGYDDISGMTEADGLGGRHNARQESGDE